MPDFYPISDEGFDSTQVRNNSAVFALFEAKGSHKYPVAAGSHKHLDDGVIEKQKQFPSAKWFKYQLEVESRLNEAEQEVKISLNL